MMELRRIYDSELRVMAVLWAAGEDMKAARIADILLERVGWNRNTTYTIIRKCIEKGFVERRGAHYVCHALITKEQARANEIQLLIERWDAGDPNRLLNTLLQKQNVKNEKLVHNLCGMSI